MKTLLQLVIVMAFLVSNYSASAQLSVTVTTTDVSCWQADDGSMLAVVSGGQTPYTYLWSFGATTPNLSGLGSAFQSVTVTDALSATVTASGQVNEPLELMLDHGANNPTCNGFSGSAVISTQLGTPPYYYLWPTGDTDVNASNLAVGSYFVTVSDANGCSGIEEVILVEPSAVSVTTQWTDASCFGLNDGTATVLPSGGIPPYTYTWLDGGFNVIGNTQTVVGLFAGAYQIDVFDANNCLATSNAFVIEPSQLSVFTAETPVTCFGGADGSATATAVGGTPGYTYMWPTGGFSPTENNLPAGAYMVTTTDANGCFATANSIITEPASALIVTSTQTDEICGGSDGTATVTASGGSTPYFYAWGGLSTTETATGLAAGAYSCFVTDNNFCTIEEQVIINSGVAITIVSTVTQPSCTGNQAGITLAPTGATSYTYVWSNAATTSSITGLAQGTYFVTVGDGLGCDVQASYNIGTAAVTPTMTIVNGTCGVDGMATAAATGGAGNYTFLWDNGFTGTTQGLTAGTYYVSVTDAAGCETSTSGVMEVGNAVNISLTATDANCGQADGSLTIDGLDAGSTYNYVWTNGSAVQTANGLMASAYSVTVSAANGCTAVAMGTVNDIQGGTISVATTPANCGVCDGTATSTVSGGTSPYIYLWSNAETVASLTSLCQSSGSVTMTDANGCVATAGYAVAGNSSLSLTLTPTDVLCSGGNSGAATTIISGGTTPYTYLWSHGHTAQNASNLTAGSYVLSVTDAVGCYITGNAQINEPTGITVGATGSIACNESTGNITITATGGVSSYTYSADGISYSATNVYTGFPAGTHNVYVQDANGCVEMIAYTLSENTTTASVTTQQFNDCSAWGYATISPIGTPPFDIDYSNGTSVTGVTGTQYMSFPVGTHSIYIVDADGCNDSIPFEITAACTEGILTGVVFQDNDDDCAYDDAADDLLSQRKVLITPGNIIRYAWNGTLYTQLPAGTYTATVIDEDPLRDPCVGTESVTFTITTQNTTEIELPMTGTEDCANVSLDLGGWAIRPCFDNYYCVSYVNDGTITSFDTEITLEIPDSITVVQPGNGFVSQTGNIMTYNVGDLAPGESGYIGLILYLECNFDLLGQTACFEVSYSDNLCSDPGDAGWDKSSVSVEGGCVDDSLACFTITNTGDAGDGDMTGTSQYRIYENDIFVFQGTFQLNGQETTEICWAAASQSIRLEADQRPGHPGNSQPRDFVEMCGEPTFSTGFIVNAAQDDDAPDTEIMCLLITSSYDPNDKQAVPVGFAANHYIDSLEQLEYTIRFQNTGSDTAFNVFVYDTIDANLDLTTLQTGISSHPMVVELIGSNVIKFNFYNIMLPDSGADLQGSNGFFKFKIDQKAGNNEGTIIENSAGIVFDFNEPIITNTVFHTVGLPDVYKFPAQTALVLNESLDLELTVYPNPMRDAVNFELVGMDQAIVNVYDMYGKLVKTSNISQGFGRIDTQDLSNGVYVYQISNKEEKLLVGKIIKQ